MKNPRYHGRWFRGGNFFAVFFRGIGLAMIAGGAVYAIVVLSFTTRAVHAEGIVIKMDTVKSALPFMEQVQGSGVLLYPVVRFTTENGKSVDFRAASGSQHQQYAIGDSVPVMYDPARPGEGRIGTLMGVWGAPLILIGIGAAFLLLGFLAPMGFGNTPRRLSSDD
ncbi:MAG TPA: DUF3592 domain-containing protein [Spirochaetia bacterium]|nr:DUF3592 domain-containing protein [Spirochaetia bacterium]